MRTFLRQSGSRILLDIKAVPGASKTEIVKAESAETARSGGRSEGRLRVRIAAAPEGGKANSCLISFFAKQLDCPKRDIVLESGEKSRLKTLSFPAAFEPALDKLAGTP